MINTNKLYVYKPEEHLNIEKLNERQSYCKLINKNNKCEAINKKCKNTTVDKCNLLPYCELRKKRGIKKFLGKNRNKFFCRFKDAEEKKCKETEQKK